MTAVLQVMTRGVRAMSLSDSVVLAAQAMDELNVGVVPVCDGQPLVGMVTDRDITVRAVAQGRADERRRLSDIMTGGVHWCFEDQPLEEVLRGMSTTQIRRLPVVDRQKHLVGMAMLGDIAAKSGEEGIDDSLGDISEPSEPDRSGYSQASGAAGGGSLRGSSSGASSGRSCAAGASGSAI